MESIFNEKEKRFIHFHLLKKENEGGETGRGGGG
jgi:hypothetical protein